MTLVYGASTPASRKERQSTANRVGAIASAAAAYTTVEECGVGALRSTKLTFTALPITMTDNGANGSGGIQVYDFPEGAIQILGSTCKITGAYATATDANVIASVGTATAAADATLTSTEANIIASTAAAVATSACSFSAVSAAPGAPIDGRTTPASVFVNIATSTDPTGNKAMTFTGTLVIQWSNIDNPD